ncbi:hypothetical protein CTI12_AA192580 [Artemisia annua]|uniref:Uncharacterized protein n=1 Tax=Artemisia annua TaxID=35608 RepID=A0A2U1NXN5_ARTAN|nr:hypothetical protein CTI12_AA192580 [Artemisia annua]
MGFLQQYKVLKLRKKGLGRTLFERLADLYGDEVISMLTVQYQKANRLEYITKFDVYIPDVEHVCGEYSDCEECKRHRHTHLFEDNALFPNGAYLMAYLEDALGKQRLFHMTGSEMAEVNAANQEAGMKHIVSLIQRMIGR